MLLLALSLGFLLGILVMVLLVSGHDEDELLDRLERAEDIDAPAESRAAGPRDTR